MLLILWIQINKKMMMRMMVEDNGNHLNFFFNCSDHEDMIQKLSPVYWKLFQIKMKPFYQSLKKTKIIRS